jgi:hypothetical protein
MITAGRTVGPDGWGEAFRTHHTAINVFNESARLDIGVSGEFSPRSTEPSPRAQYEKDRAGRDPFANLE